MHSRCEIKHQNYRHLTGPDKPIKADYIFSKTREETAQFLSWFLVLSMVVLCHSWSAHAQITVCGDGIVDPGEECDDGNSIGYDTCNNSCVQGLDIQLVSIPAGKFLMGNNLGEKDESPEHLVSLNDNFLFSKTEVTHKQYKACVAAGDCTPAAVGNGCIWGTTDTDDYPINCVNWKQANDFANFVGLRLPTEAEWEYVASSGDQRTYPWGEETPSCDFMVLQSCSQLSQPVCTSDEVPRDGQLNNQLYPICDLAGNVAEWVEDNYSVNYADAFFIGIFYFIFDCRLKFY
jgi:cysteine-rich repeat protein